MRVRPGFSSISIWSLTAVLGAGLLAGCQPDRIVAVPELTPDQVALSADLRTRAELEGVSPFAEAPHMFDGYVWASDPNAASYTPNATFSFNRTGGAITITRPAGTTGLYTVRFQGLSALLGSNSTLKVTAEFTGTYCKPDSWKLANDIVNIRCVSESTGALQNSYYTVVVTRHYVELAFAHAQLPTASNYVPVANSSWNPAPPGTMRVFRVSQGEYQVRFDGLGSRLTTNGGHAQVVATGTDRHHCKVRSWSGNPNLVVSVGCMTRNGAPQDLKFNVLFLMPTYRLGYAWADQPSAISYTPDAGYSYNSSGGAVGITRSSTGTYTVTFSGLAAELLGGGNVQVTAYGPGSAQCRAANAVSGSTESVDVRCFAPGGAPVDAQYTVFTGS
jgi:hypothetical protein